MEESNYYPFGLEHKSYNTNKAFRNALAKQWKFGGKEYQEELDLIWYDITARNYDPALGRWMSINPLAEQMRRHSPYNYAFDNPLRFIDPDGMMPVDIIKPEFQDDATKAAYVNTVENATGNTYQVIADPLINGGNVLFTQVAMGPLTQKQQAFVDVYESAIDSPAIADIEIVSNDVNVEVGDITDNKIDIADIAEFDRAGNGGASSAGVLAHETKEQQLKAESGGIKGVYPQGAFNMHRQAIRTAEDKVNGNHRQENPSTGLNVFYETNGTKTLQTIIPNISNGSIIVNKTNIP